MENAFNVCKDIIWTLLIPAAQYVGAGSTSQRMELVNFASKAIVLNVNLMEIA